MELLGRGVTCFTWNAKASEVDGGEGFGDKVLLWRDEGVRERY